MLDQHARFLVNFVAMMERSSGGESSENKKVITKLPLRPMQRPTMDSFLVKSHWMDNVRVRKMCDEMLHLESGGQHKLPDPPSSHNKQQGASTFMRTLQLALGQQVNVLKMSNNPEVTIGGYFIMSQMLSYIKVLVSLDLSSNNLTAAEARVLSLGLKSNHSVQELRMKDNMIGSEGATTMGDMLKVNDTILLMDLRMNNIRGAGFCALADAVSENRSLTELDMRWNYAGECSDFVEIALRDLKDFCFRNMIIQLDQQQRKPSTPEVDVKEGSEIEVNSQKEDNQKILPSPPKSPYLLPQDEIAPAIGRLEVTIISARNLPQVIWTSGKDGEFMGLPQAYCTFTLNKQTTSTSIMRKNWAPTWNHTVSIDVRQVWQVCSLKVMHSKSLTRRHPDDYIIGNVSIPVGAIINWRGVQHVDADNTWRAYHRPIQAPRGGQGNIYNACRSKAKNGEQTDVFETAEEAARAYDETAMKIDNERACLNLSGEYDYVGQHVKDELYPLSGEDGISVIGVQAGVASAVRLRLKFYSCHCNYLEMHLDKATSLPKMDAGLGSCDAYCILNIGDYEFRTRIVRNSLDPQFRQTFRIAMQEVDEPLQITVSVWDWDKWNEDDHMGTATMEIDTKKVASGAYDNSYPFYQPEKKEFLVNAKKEKSLIHMRFTYTEASHAFDDPDDHHDDNQDYGDSFGEA